MLIESASPVIDQTKTSNDLSPVQEQRAWDQQADDNVIDKLERSGLVAPRGEVDKVLETVVNNLEVTNNLDIATRNSMPRSDDFHHRIFFDGAYHRAQPRID